MTTDLSSKTVVQRWTTPIATPHEGGGFVAYGDYLELERRLEEAQLQIVAQKTKENELQRQVDVQLETNIKLLEWRDRSYEEQVLHDAKIAAEAKAEALEEAEKLCDEEADAYQKSEGFKFQENKSDAEYGLRGFSFVLQQKAAEYRAKATEAGRKE